MRQEKSMGCLLISIFSYFCVAYPVIVCASQTAPTISVQLLNSPANKAENFTTEKNDLIIVEKSAANPFDSKGMEVTCSARYPVSLVFEGVGDFNFLSGGQGSSDCAEKNGELCIPKYWIRKDIAGLRSDHTGKFVCSGKSQNNNLTSSFSIYVEGNSHPFVRQRGGNVYFTNETEAVLPCLSSIPNTTVSLVKVEKDGETMEDFAEFKYHVVPGEGVKFAYAEESYEPGTYLCLASLRNRTYFAEYNVKRLDDACTKSCPELGTTCEKKGKTEACVCAAGFEKVLLLEGGFPETKCVRKCGTDEDCPAHLVCQLTYTKPEKVNTCVNPCYSAPCIGHDCKVENRKPVCNVQIGSA
ncbi:uncharacterized protein LOC110854522 [Folsomia candida]|uniref:Vascular endothelial growth factor receptor kdr-like n=1 Tax=Folsomia candida TaxID=158441 RepID=A0A226DWN2_FOLCA|nr:uncharacterized protein LOC110854522 [Folsomia candida]OXA49127.1 Vascular endothelial growth factor receptor kdr-like [Folsomia candida]